MTPFRTLYGQDPPLLIRRDTYPTKLEEVKELQENRDRLLDELKLNLQTAQQQMKYYADKHRREVQFDMGDWVFLRL